MKADLIVVVFEAADLLASLAATIWVARSLGDGLDESPKRLVVAGFYLTGLGCSLLAMSLGALPEDVAQALRWLCLRVGALLMIFGAVHRIECRLFGRAGP